MRPRHEVCTTEQPGEWMGSLPGRARLQMRLFAGTDAHGMMAGPVGQNLVSSQLSLS
jgi:hypothetical protein